MATPVFPQVLPSPITVAGLQAAPRVYATEEELAAWTVREYTRDPGATCDVTWDFRTDEFDAFYTFWETSLLRGKKWFWLNLATSVAADSWQLVRFDDQYTMQPKGFRHFAVQAKLELRDRFFRTSRSYTLPAPFDWGTTPPSELVPNWADVRFAAEYSGFWQFDDAKSLATPSIAGTVVIATGAGAPPHWAHVQGDEAYLDYGAAAAMDLSAAAGWTVECRFRNQGGEKNSVVWEIAGTDTRLGLSVCGSAVTFFHYAPNGTILAQLPSAVAPADGWFHAVVQKRRGKYELACTANDAPTGLMTVVAPAALDMPSGAPTLYVGADADAFNYEDKKYLTGGVDDLCITAIAVYP